MLLLDTDILIDVQRGYAPAVDWFCGLDTPPTIPGFVVIELIQDAKNAAQQQLAGKLVKPLPVVWPEQADCVRALEYFERWHLSHGIGLLDALIAACATGISATLCTFNTKHYRVIPDLNVLPPYKRPG